MEVSKILQVAAGTASVGGLALAVFLVLCRDIVRKNIFPNLTRQHAFQIIRLIVVLAFCASLAGLAAWVYLERSNVSPAAIAVPTSPKTPSLSWQRSSVRDDIWRLSVEDGPLFNLRIGFAYYLDLAYFPPGLQATDALTTLVQPDLTPAYSVETNGTAIDFYFQIVEGDLADLAGVIEEFRTANPGSRALLDYTLIIQVKYDSESGAQFTRAWSYKATLTNASGVKAQAFTPQLVSNEEFDKVTQRQKSLEDCEFIIIAPSLAAQRQRAPLSIDAMFKNPPRCKRHA
jgi:hypothetical protein